MGQVDCKPCSTGTFVAEKDRPGTSAVSCRACPYGKECVSGSDVDQSDFHFSMSVEVIRICSGFA